MPSILIEVRKQHSTELEGAIINAAHQSVLNIFKVLPNALITRLATYEPHRFACPPGLSHPELYTHISIDCLIGRSLETKRKLYKDIVENLESLGIPKDHIKIILREILRENAGVRGGQALCDVDLGFETNI